MKNILIVDDHPMFAEGVQFLIEQNLAINVADVLNKGHEVLPYLSKNKVDIILLDVDLPDISGFEIAQAIKEMYPNIKIIALSMLNDTHTIKRMIEAGVDGYCVKSAGREELFEAIKKIDNGNVYFPTHYLSQLKIQKFNDKNNPLSKREAEISRLILDGNTSSQIAQKLFLSIRTVETHRKNIYHKLGVHSNIELVSYIKNTQKV